VKIFKQLMLVVITASSTTAVFADNALSSYHWGRAANPFTLTVVDSVTTEWDAYLKVANDRWTKSIVLNLNTVGGNTSTTEAAGRALCLPVLGRIRVCNHTYGNNGWLGVAQIWISGDHITQAVTKLNDSYFKKTTYNKPEWRQMVMCQEIGHGLGLSHQDENFNNPNINSCMDYTNQPLTNMYPNLHDYDQLLFIYNHLDKTPTVGSGVQAVIRRNSANTRAQWGPMVATNPNGRIQTFEGDFGKGNILITHVFWADPIADEIILEDLVDDSRLDAR